VVIISLTNVSNFLHTYIISAVAFQVESDLHFGSGLQYALLVGPVFTLAKTASAAPIGRLLEIVNRVNLLALLTAVWSLSTFLMGYYATTYQQLLALRILQGMAESGCVPIGQSLLFDVTPTGKLGTAMAIYNTGVYIGYGIAIGLGAAIGRRYGWRMTFCLFGIFSAPLVVVMILTLRDPPQGERDTKHAPKRVIHRTNTAEFLRRWAATPGLLLLCFGCALRNSGGIVWGYNIVLYYQSQGVSAGDIAFWLSWVPMVAGTFGSMIGGYYSDRVIKWKPDGGRLWLLAASCAISAPFLLLAMTLPLPFNFLCLIPAYAISEMWLGVAMTVMVGMVPDAMRTSSVALYLFLVDNFGAAGLLILQPISEVVGYQTAMLLLVPGVYIMSGGLFLSIGSLISRDVGKKLEKSPEKTTFTPLSKPNKAISASSESKITYGSLDSKDEDSAESQQEAPHTPLDALRQRHRRSLTLVDLLDMVQADVCWHRGHECMVCTCTRPKRF